MDIQEKTYSEIIAEISIADERFWLADEANRETLNNTFFIDADGSAQTIQEGNGELPFLPYAYLIQIRRWLSCSISREK